jgi:hypothetical protein
VRNIKSRNAFKKEVKIPIHIHPYTFYRKEIAMFRSRYIYRLCLSFVLVFQLALCAVIITPDTAQANPFKKAKKKAKKALKKAQKSANNEISDARKDLSKTGQAVNNITGEIAGQVDHAYDLTEGELMNATNYVGTQFDNLSAQLIALSQEAIMAVYKEAYQKNAKDYVQLTQQVGLVQYQIANELEDLASNLIEGNFKKTETLARELVAKDNMRAVKQAAQSVFGNQTAIIIQVDAEVGGSGVGAGTSRGVAINLTSGSPSVVIFQSAGGAVTSNQGVSSSVTMGFVRGGTANVPGPSIEVSLSNLKLGFIPELQNQPPWLPKTSSFVPAYAVVSLQLPGEPPVDPNEATTIAVGASYCQALQKIK